MTEERWIFVKFMVGLIIVGMGYLFKGLPMAVALLVGWFIIWKFHKKKPEQYQEYEEDSNNQQ